MANYSALWTSHNDPEYIQIKKVKQLTERKLAMSISNMDKNYRRQVRKAQEQIRENQDILELLEKEKETRARQILATYHKHQRMKAAADKLIGKFRLKKEKREQAAKEEGANEKTTKAVSEVDKMASSLQPGLRHRVLMVYTFPFLYHSYGYKPCPRYNMFLESQEYGPPEVISKVQQPRSSIASKGDSLNKSMVPALPQLPVVSKSLKSSTSSMRKVVTAFKVLNLMSQK